MVFRRSLNPMVDVLFKFIFGAEERKHVTLDFLNAVLSLEGEQELKDIHFLDRELVPESDEAKLSRLDIYGVTDDGSQVDIEVQIVNRKNMEKRTLYYWSRMYQVIGTRRRVYRFASGHYHQCAGF
jgi:predicted transposase/invertase (TIGR01784 family)